MKRGRTIKDKQISILSVTAPSVHSPFFIFSIYFPVNWFLFMRCTSFHFGTKLHIYKENDKVRIH